jgi:hypothetical protein
MRNVNKGIQWSRSQARVSRRVGGSIDVFL